MKKEFMEFESTRDFRLAHQTLCITGFNFENESLVGYVDMLIYPRKPFLRKVKINSKQCKIYRVAVNDVWEASFSYNDPTLEICQTDSKIRTLDYFENYHSTAMTDVDADAGNGELTIKLPPEVLPLVQDMKSFRISIEFSLEDPKGGIKFVVPDTDGTLLDRGAHLFSYGRENSSRLWFPCIDCYSEVCTWKLEFTVHMYMIAVSVGELIETVYTTDLRKKTYHYYLSVPTAAPNIALAVGPFEVLVDPYMHEVTHFCLPQLMPILKHTTSFLHEVFEFYEEALSSHFPYTCYKQVFVDMAYSDISAYASMTICSTNLLHSKQIIDQTPVTRQLLAQAVAQQFFGCFISMNSWYDAWLPKGLASYLCGHYRLKTFGFNAFKYAMAQDMREVCEHELQMGPVILDPSLVVKDVGLYFPTKSPHTTSPIYSSIYEKKAHLIVRMLALRIGQQQMFQVLNKLLALAFNASQQKFSDTWSKNMLISTDSFLKSISSVTGKDVSTFVEQWVHQGGVVRFVGEFIFNRKRNVVEIELKQDWTAKGSLKYAGPLTITIQELDGTFHHPFMIEENKTKFEITCHSKSRRQKKKKIPLSTMEEVEMNLDDTDQDSPVLWLRIDPEMTILRHVKLKQADYMWQYMLRYERCVASQYDAICSLENYSTKHTRNALMHVIEEAKHFYLVRIDAANSLTKVSNAQQFSSNAQQFSGNTEMMAAAFAKMFSSRACDKIVRQNDFSNFQLYFLQKAMPVAMAGLRNLHNNCPQDIVKFLRDLFKYNDNSKNKYSDGYYRAALVDALATTITSAVTPVTITGSGPSSDSLTSDTKEILEEITNYLNMEKLLPCYRLSVTVSCLKAIRTLQKFGHLPCDPAIFKSYAVEGNFIDVRLAALEALVSYAGADSSADELSWLLDLVESDPDPYLRFRVVEMLIAFPPFTRPNSTLNTENLVERLWNMMNSKFAHDSRLRCAVADLYYVLYGRSRPSCLIMPEEQMDTPFFKSEDSHGSHFGKRRLHSPLNSLSFDDRNSVFGSDLKVESAQDDGSPVKLKILVPGPSLSSNFPLSSFSSYGSSDSVPKAAFEVTVKEDDTSMRLSEDSSSESSSPLHFDEPYLEQVVSPPPPSKLFGSSMFSFSPDSNTGLGLTTGALGSSSSVNAPTFPSSNMWLSSSSSGFPGLSGQAMYVSGDFREQGKTHEERRERKRKRSESDDKPLNLSSYRTGSSDSSGGSSPAYRRDSSKSPDDLI